MTLTVHFQWWMIPALITILSYCWAFFWPFKDNTGFMAGLVNLFALIPASGASLIAWIIAGFMK